MKVLTIVGARPQFIKAAMVSKAIAESDDVSEEIIHTGQHYDANMSDIFFEQMRIPKPAVRMKFGGRSHGAMTGQMLEAIESEIVQRKPDVVLVYGDTNSTLAGALAAAKLCIPVAHVEAGLRSFNKRMPEEINRIMTDHASTYLFCPTSSAVQHLKNEGIVNGVHQVGDVMYDAALFFGEISNKHSNISHELELNPGSYHLATVHRQENTDNLVRLKNIFEAFDQISSKDCPLILPLHPRTKGALEKAEIILSNSNIRLLSPLSFLDMVQLEKNAKIILTDSGGVQKEAYFHKVPCITLRDETEWVETVSAGWNQIVGANCPKILLAVRQYDILNCSKITEYGNGHSSEDIVQILCSLSSQQRVR